MIFNSLGGGHTHTHTQTDFVDENNFKKPGAHQPLQCAPSLITRMYLQRNQKSIIHHVLDTYTHTIPMCTESRNNCPIANTVTSVHLYVCAWSF